MTARNDGNHTDLELVGHRCAKAACFAGAGIILHTGIGLRWPFTLKATHDP